MQTAKKAVRSDELHLKWWSSPPSWINYFSRFWSNDLFPVATNHVRTKFYEPFFSRQLICYALCCVKIQNGGRRHAKCHFCAILYGITTCRTSNLVGVYVQ